MTSTWKTILLMGGSGSGKTTMINAMINFVLGVEWDDPFRFMLVDEQVRKTQAHSQTRGVTVFDLHYQDGFRIPFSLTNKKYEEAMGKMLNVEGLKNALQNEIETINVEITKAMEDVDKCNNLLREIALYGNSTFTPEYVQKLIEYAS